MSEFTVYDGATIFDSNSNDQFLPNMYSCSRSATMSSKVNVPGDWSLKLFYIFQLFVGVFGPRLSLALGCKGHAYTVFHDKLIFTPGNH